MSCKPNKLLLIAAMQRKVSVIILQFRLSRLQQLGRLH